MHPNPHLVNAAAERNAERFPYIAAPPIPPMRWAELAETARKTFLYCMRQGMKKERQEAEMAEAMMRVDNDLTIAAQDAAAAEACETAPAPIKARIAHLIEYRCMLPVDAVDVAAREHAVARFMGVAAHKRDDVALLLLVGVTPIAALEWVEQGRHYREHPLWEGIGK